MKLALDKSRRESDLSSNGVQGNKFSSVLPEVYAGHPLRIERYTQYDQMDMDSEVNAALDTIADFCTQKDENTGDIFELTYNGEQSDTEIEILKTCMRQWCKINEFDKRFWRTFRSTLKYGDQFFIRDPETLKWFWIEQCMVEKVIVNEAEGKTPEAYLVRNLNLNTGNLTGTQSQSYGNNVQGTGTNTLSQFTNTTGAINRSGPVANLGGRYSSDSNQTLTAVDATHMIHLSLSEGLDANWPFGISILESVYKVFRQKELLEDAIIIYRIIRAPERRIFYIDTGQMPPHKAGAYIEKVKNEIYNKRIPSRSGGGSQVGVDAAYSPMCLDMTTRVPLLDGRTLSIAELADEYRLGKENWAYSCNPADGEIVPGKITWAGITRKQAQVIKLHLDNNTTIICTPDHKFPVIGKGDIQAQNLTPKDKLISFNAKKQGFGYAERYHQQEYDQEVPPSDHKITSTEWLNEQMDVGTITIDGKEEHHDYHNFAIEQGIIGKNSMIDDFFFSQCCATTTLIPLLDGRTPTLQQIIDEYEEGKLNYVYSQNETTFEFEPGKIIWAGKTRLNAQVVEVILDNGNTITTTPDHQFILSNGDAIEAKDLKSETVLMPWHSNQIEDIRVECVKWLDKRINTGDITIETQSCSHIFAVAAGVYIHNSGDGRGSKVETLPGGQSLGEIQDLRYFSNKLLRGMRVPASYIPTGTDDSTQAMNDGRAGTAYVQEFRFAKYCQRLQTLIAPVFDTEFKLFVKQRGFNIESSIYELNFTTPQHFSDFARAEKDTALINVFQPLVELKYFSKRFLMKRYLGMTEEELTENEEMWQQENPDAVANLGGGDSASSASSMAADAAPGIDSMGLGGEPAGDDTQLPADPTAGPSLTPTTPDVSAGDATGEPPQ